MLKRRGGQLRRLLFGLLLVVLVGGIIALRLGRHSFDKPYPVRGSVLGVRNSFVYVYAARSGDRVLLFDCGTDPEGRGLLALLSAMHALPAQVSDVFITHGHGDHTAGARLFPGARIHAGLGDVEMIAHRAAIAPTFARPMGLILPSPSVEVTAPLNGPSDVPVGGGLAVKAFPLPGHTPGSFAFLYEGVLFVGDSMQRSDRQLEFSEQLFSVARAENKRSIASLRGALEGIPVAVVCTGHGGCTEPSDTSSLLADLFRRAGL